MAISECTKMIISLVLIIWFFSTRYLFPKKQGLDVSIQNALNPENALLNLGAQSVYLQPQLQPQLSMWKNYVQTAPAKNSYMQPGPDPYLQAPNPYLQAPKGVNYACLNDGAAQQVFESYISEPNNVPVPVRPVTPFTDIQLVSNFPCVLQLTGAVYGEINDDGSNDPNFVSPFIYNKFSCQFEDSSFTFPMSIVAATEPNIGRPVPLKYVGSKCASRYQVDECMAMTKCTDNFHPAATAVDDINCVDANAAVCDDCDFTTLGDYVQDKSMPPTATYSKFGFNSVSQTEPDHWRGITFKQSPSWSCYTIEFNMRFVQASDIFEAGLAFNSLAPNSDDRLYAAFRHMDNFTPGVVLELDAGTATSLWHQVINANNLVTYSLTGAPGVTLKTSTFSVKYVMERDLSAGNQGGKTLTILVNNIEVASGTFTASQDTRAEISLYVGDCTTVHISEFYVTLL